MASSRVTGGAAGVGGSCPAAVWIAIPSAWSRLSTARRSARATASLCSGIVLAWMSTVNCPWPTSSMPRTRGASRRCGFAAGFSRNATRIESKIPRTRVGILHEADRDPHERRGPAPREVGHDLDLAVRDEVDESLRVAKLGVPQREHLHRSRRARDADDVSDRELVVVDDVEPGDPVPDERLCSESRGDAKPSRRGQRRRDVEAQLADSHQDPDHDRGSSARTGGARRPRSSRACPARLPCCVSPPEWPSRSARSGSTRYAPRRWCRPRRGRAGGAD